MLNKVKTMITIIVLSAILISASAQAATIHVKNGNTHWEIAQVHNTTVELIKDWNHLDTDLIRPVQVLTISPKLSYRVKKGDTLWAISREHHIHVSQLMECNSLSTDLIHPGLNLVIPDRSTSSKEAVIEKPSKLVNRGHSQATFIAAPIHKKRVYRVAAASTTVPSSGRAITVTATAYTPSCAGCSGITATGMNVMAHPNAKVIAVDPSVIPLGSKVYIEGLGVYIAGDTGGAIKGNRIDVMMASVRAALNFGRKQVKLTILQ